MTIALSEGINKDETCITVLGNCQIFQHIKLLDPTGVLFDPIKLAGFPRGEKEISGCLMYIRFIDKTDSHCKDFSTVLYIREEIWTVRFCTKVFLMRKHLWPKNVFPVPGWPWFFAATLKFLLPLRTKCHKMKVISCSHLLFYDL